MWAVRRLGSFMRSRLPEHEVLSQLPDFLRFSVSCAEKRLLRMGVLTKPLAELAALEKGLAVAEAYGAALLRAPLRLLPKRRLTETYLQDPSILRQGDGEPPLRAVR